MTIVMVAYDKKYEIIVIVAYLRQYEIIIKQYRNIIKWQYNDKKKQ